MTLLVQLWVPQRVMEVNIYAKLRISLLDFKQLILVCHLIDPLFEELLLLLHAKVARPKDERVDF